MGFRNRFPRVELVKSNSNLGPAFKAAVPAGVVGPKVVRELLKETEAELSEKLDEVLLHRPQLHRTPASYAFNVRFYGASSVDALECLAAARQDLINTEAQSLYLHYPFCDYLCRFCHYAVVPWRAAAGLAIGDLLRENLSLLLKKIPEVRCAPISSVYFGGGTPSLAQATERARLVNNLREVFDITAECEWAIEANPETVNHDFLAHLNDVGFNRLSVGVQVLDDHILSWLGRGHSVSQAMEALFRLREEWDEPFNVDLIYGLPGVRPEKLLQDIDVLARLEVPSITLYRLRLGRPDERASALKSEYDKRSWEFPSQGETVTQIAAARRLLEERGYKEGPIGWFVRPGAEAVCYKDRWLQQRPLLGLGMSAYSYGDNWQFSQCRQLKRWAKAVECRELPIESAFVLSKNQSSVRSLAFKLRYTGTIKNEGGDGNEVPRRLSSSLQRLGLCRCEEVESPLTELGLALIDEIVDEFLFSHNSIS